MLFIEKYYTVPIAKASFIKHRYMTMARIYLNSVGSVHKNYFYRTAEVYVQQRGTEDYVQVCRWTRENDPQLEIALEYFRGRGFVISDV